ncbi:MAG: leucine-rich repeat protein [Pirellulales bacterium]
MISPLPCRWKRGLFLSTLPVALATVLLGGCDKAKELVDQGKEKIAEMQKQSETPPADATAPVAPAPVTQAAPAPVAMSEDQILASILAKEAYQRNDEDLTKLAALSEPYRTRVDVLNLRGAQVTEVGLQNLAKLTGLKELQMTQARLTPGGYAAIGNATSLEKLVLDNSDINDNTLGSLKGLIHLKSLNLETTQISDAGLAQLRQCTELEELQISNTMIDGSCFRQMKNLAVLKKLGAYNTRIGSAGASSLRAAKNLEHLSIGKAGISDPFLAELKGCVNLVELNLQENAVSDAGIKFLSGCIKLEKLNLKSTGVTDQGLVQVFGRAKNLKEVYAPGSGISERGAAALKKKIPDVNVILQ